MSFHEMYERYAAALHRFAMFLSGDASLADDITSETFYRAWTSTAPIRQATIQSYLFTIAKNCYRDIQRKERRNVALDERVPDPSISVEKRVEDSSNLGRLLEALKALPELDRSALLLRSEMEMSYEAIGETLGLSPGAVKVRVHRARAKLLGVQGASL